MPNILAPRCLVHTAATALLAAMPTGLLASEGPGIEGIDVEVGETEIEVEIRILDDADTGLQLQLQSEHALSEQWAIGGEIEFEREAGEALKADSALARLKWRGMDEDKGFAIALQGGAGYSFADQQALAEAAIFAGWSDERWSLAAKADVETLLARGAEPEFGYRFRALRAVAEGVALGVESAGEMSAGEPDEHRIGPIAQLPLGGNGAPTLELGAFAGLNRDTPDMFYRIEVGFEF